MNERNQGPWKIGRESQDTKDPVFWNVDILNGSGTIHIARVYGVGQGRTRDNARLVATSPKLLDACKNAFKNLEGMNQPKGSQDRGRRLAALSTLAFAINQAEDGWPEDEIK